MSRLLTATEAKQELFLNTVASMPRGILRRAKICAAIQASGLCKLTEPDDEERPAFEVDAIIIRPNGITLVGFYWGVFWAARDDLDQCGQDLTLTIPHDETRCDDPDDLCCPQWWGDTVYSSVWCDVSEYCNTIWLRRDVQDAVKWEDDPNGTTDYSGSSGPIGRGPDVGAVPACSPGCPA